MTQLSPFHGVHVALTPDEKIALRAVFPTRPESACKHCGGYHLRACPRIKRIAWIGEGAGTGNEVEVEYWPAFDDENIIWPEDVYDEEDDSE